MRRKLQELIRGTTESKRAGIIFPEKEIRFSVIEDDLFQGRFSFSSGDDKIIRGLVSCPDPHIHCMTPKFEAKKAEIMFEYRADGMTEGRMQQGYFVITSDAGEYLFPYYVHVRKDYAHTSIGWIKTLNDFTNLAKLNPEEALLLFRSPKFLSVFGKGQKKERDLYQALISRGAGYAQMEEFLIGAGKKSRNHFTVKEDKQTFLASKRPITETIHVEKNGWGNEDIRVSADRSFIKLNQVTLQQEDFRGNHMELEYQVLPDELHAGKNFGCIRLENADETADVLITAMSEQSGISGSGPRALSEKRARTRLARLYLEYRLGRVTETAWKEDSLRLISNYLNIDPEDDWFRLYQSFIFLSTGNLELGGTILDRFLTKNNLKRTPQEAFCQYLCLLRDPAGESRTETALFVRDCYKRYPNHPVLAWVLLQTDDAISVNQDRRYQFLKRLSESGDQNPVFYLEAYLLVRENPALMHRMEDYERRLIRWIVMHDLNTEELIGRMTAYAKSLNQFSETDYRILEKAYLQYSSPDFLKAFCSWLIKNSCYEERFFLWYELAVKEKIRVVGLYEAYLRTWDPRQSRLPQEIIQYFLLQKNIPWQWKAKIYAYLINNQKNYTKQWAAWEIQIRSFAAACLKDTLINDDLYTVYCFYREAVGESEWNMMKGDIESVYRIEVRNPRLTHLCIWDGETRQMHKVSLKNGLAFMKKKNPDQIWLLQDEYNSERIPDQDAEIRQMFVPAEAAEDTAASGERAGQNTERGRSLTDRLEAFDDSLDALDALILDAKKEGVHCQDYEAQLLARSLFTGHLTPSYAEIFADIARNGENILLCDAYVSFISKGYLCDEIFMSEAEAGYILQSRQNGRKLNDFCDAALLKYHYTSFFDPVLEERHAQRMLEQMICSGRTFGFYNLLPAHIRTAFLLQGCLYIQYNGDTRGHILLDSEMSFRQEEGEGGVFAQKTEMTESLPGIYCASVFVLPGADLHYRILQGDAILEEETIQVEPDYDDGSPVSRYRMLSGLFLVSGKAEPIEEYRSLDRAVSELFTFIEEQS